MARTGLPATVVSRLAWWERKGWHLDEPLEKLLERRANTLDTVDRRRAACVDFAKRYSAELITAPETIDNAELKAYVDDLDVLRKWSCEVAAFDVLIAEKRGGKVLAFRPKRPALFVVPEPDDEPPRPTG